MKVKSKNVHRPKLDKEEKDLLDSFDRGEWKSVKNIKKEKATAKHIAANSLKKDQRINIRLSSYDLELLKEKAAYEGIPYQTLVTSVLHKYAVGHL